MSGAALSPRAWRIPRGIGWAAPALGTALAAAILRAAPEAPLPFALATLAVAATTAWIVVQDLATLTIPDAAVATLAVLAAALRWSGADGSAGPTFAAMGLDVLLCGGALLLFREGYYRLRGVDGLGLGDVKLAAAGALLVTSLGFAWALFAASLAGLAAVAASRLVTKHAARPDRIALGATLAPAIFVVFLIEQVLPRLGGG